VKSNLYAVLSGLLGAGMVFAGAAMFVNFFAAHAPGAIATLPVGPNGMYFVAFSGCATIAWGSCLLGQMRRNQASRSVASATVVGLILSATYRIAVWVVGDYHVWIGNLARIEAVLFLLLALAFLWLRPAPRKEIA
jgi:hypothetical protein